MKTKTGIARKVLLSVVYIVAATYKVRQFLALFTKHSYSKPTSVIGKRNKKCVN